MSNTGTAIIAAFGILEFIAVPPLVNRWYRRQQSVPFEKRWPR